MCEAESLSVQVRVAVLAKVAVLAGLLLALPAPLAAQEPEPWEDSLYNPAPLDDDEFLPMPCGGRMAFRYVGTEAPADVLGDQQIVLGQASDETNYSEYVRQEHIVGSLSQAPLGQRRSFFWMGKYEVTQDQYAAVMEDTCPEPTIRGRMPATGLTWFDAVAFSRAYTEWLYQNEPDSLPMEGERRTYLRLPTEVEWEFAARGGNVVGQQQFRERLFPMSEEISQYVWFQGPRSADGRLHPVGLLRPNPLRLHDMIGNAEEFVLGPYQMNRTGRRHGQVGGFVTRGGSFRDPGERMRSSMRTEYSYFDETTGQATRLDTFGFRLVLSAPISVSQDRIEQIRTAWTAAFNLRIDTDSFNPITELDQLAQGTTDRQTQQTLERIAAAFRSEIADRNEIEARALRRAISAAAILIRTLRIDDGLVRSLSIACEYERGQTPAGDRARDVCGRLDGLRERFENTLRAYFDILVQVADDYAESRQVEHLALQLQEFRDGGLDVLIPYAERFNRQSLDYQRTRVLDRETYLRQILE